MDEALKQRLVGAIVLVVLAVIFLPLLLDGSGMVKPAQTQLNLELPAASHQVPQNTVTITLKPQAVAKPTASSIATPTSSAASTAKPKAVTEVKKITPKPKTKSEPKPTRKPEKASKDKVNPKPKTSSKPQSAPVGKGQWVVQLGSFSQRSNAQAMRDQLINKGYQSFVEVSGQGSKQVFRVRVGPVVKREQAEHIRQKLKVNEKRDALVMSYP